MLKTEDIDWWRIFVLQAIATDSPNEATSFTCRQLNIPYFRFNPSLAEKIDLKEVHSKRLVGLILDTKRYCSEMQVRDELAHIVQLLHAAVRANQSQAMFRSSVSSASSDGGGGATDKWNHQNNQSRLI